MFLRHKISYLAMSAIAIVFLAGILFFNYEKNKTPDAKAAGPFVSVVANAMGFAWSQNIGWLSFNNRNCDANNDGNSDVASPPCPAIGSFIQGYGVNLNADKTLSGYAWSENIGWVKFDPPPDFTSGLYPNCPATTCPGGSPNYSAKYDSASKKITGWARACAGTINGDCNSATRTDGWDGWILLGPDDKGTGDNGAWIDNSLSPNQFKGWAWGGDVVGWISFNSSTGGGATPYKVYLNPTSFVCGTSKVYDTDTPPNEYNTVQIGSQCWMKENMNATHDPANNPITRHCYNDDLNICGTGGTVNQGGLYDWDTTMDGSTTEGAQGICPSGWHVPKDSEWHDLESSLKDDYNPCALNRNAWACATAGTKLKPSGSSGFEGVLGGFYSPGSPHYQASGALGIFWSSTASGLGYAWFRDLDGNPLSGSYTLVGRGETSTYVGYSVRCLKNSANTPPTVTNFLLTAPTPSQLCGPSAPEYNFSWDYNDSGAQSKYELQIDNDSNFSSPTADRIALFPPASAGRNSRSIPLTSLLDTSSTPGYDPMAGNLSYQNTTYYWRVKVYDLGADSGWVPGVPPLFTTPAHLYPDAKITCSPDLGVSCLANHSLLELIQFNDGSTCYNNSNGSIPCSNWSWDFDNNGTIDSSIQNPTHQYTPAGSYSLVFTAGDGLYSCPKIYPITIGTSISPKWKEVIPR